MVGNFDSYIEGIAHISRLGRGNRQNGHVIVSAVVHTDVVYGDVAEVLDTT